MAATFQKINDFAEQIGLATHNLNTATLNYYLNRSDAAGGAGAAVTAADTVIANVVQPTGTGYAAIDSENSWAESGGTATLTCSAKTWTGGAGGWTSFQNVILANAAGSVNLICFWAYTGDLALAEGETFTIKPSNSATTGTVFTLA